MFSRLYNSSNLFIHFEKLPTPYILGTRWVIIEKPDDVRCDSVGLRESCICDYYLMILRITLSSSEAFFHLGPETFHDAKQNPKVGRVVNHQRKPFGKTFQRCVSFSLVDSFDNKFDNNWNNREHLANHED